METYKHSTRPPKSFNGFSSYDVVYGGSLAPRADEYIEIFSELHSSSSLTASSLIPILDLPAVDDVVSGFDSRFDYSEVFGEFGNVEFALPFDELFKQSDGGDCSSDEAWTPAGADSLSDSSDLWACSEKDQCFQSGDSQQPYDSKQFSASYHKVNLAFREDMAKTTHVAHLNAIPVYNYIVDEPTSLQKSDEERFCSQVADDIILSMDSLGNMTREKQISKNASHVSNDSLQSFDNYHRRERAFSSSSNPNSTFFSVSDFSHRAEPSHLPLPLMSPIVLADGPGNSFKLTSDSKASKSHAFDTTFDGSSPPFFDVVVDASSSAVIKEAIGKAQAKMESAKELIERKKDVLQNGAKPCFRSGKGIMKTSDERGVSDERLQAACEGANAEMKNPNRGSHDIMNVIEVFPDPSRAEKVTNLAGKPSQRKQEKKPSSYFDPVLIEDGEWKEATKYYEFVTVDGSEIASRRRNNANNVAQVAKSSQPKQLEDCEEDSLNLIGEFVEPKDIRPRLKATKSASRQEYHERMVKVVQEVHEQERVISEHTETEKRLKGTWERNGKDIKPKMDLKQEIDEGILDQASQAVDRRKYKEAAQDEAKMMLNNSLGRAQSKKREKEACKRDENEKIEEAFERVKEALESEEKERRMKEHGREESERRKKEPFVNEENELRLKKASNGQQNGEHLEDAYKQKTGKENWDKNKTELKEAVEKEPCGEGIRGDYEIRENGNIEEVQQRINYECKHVEEVVQEGPEEVLVEDVRQEECTKHREAIEIEKSMKWMDQANELDMDEVQKMDQKMEMVIEQEQAEKTSEEVSTELENGEVERPEGIFETCVQVEWEYTDEKPDSSPEIDFHVEGECLKVSDSACSLDENDVKQYEISCQNGKPQKETKPNEVMLGRKDGGDFKTMPLFGEGGSEAAKKAQVLIDGRQSEYLHGHVSRDASELLLGNKNTKRGTMLEENKEVPVAILGPKVIWGPNHLQGGRGNGFARVQAFSGWETDKDTENERNMEAVWSVFSEKNQSTVRRYRLSSTSQNIERNGKSINSNPTMEERAEMERLKRERELEEERLRKHEEEREREREREKDRIAVEIATREARDRAQRAAFERATAEARQRAMAEARERLEKACAEARERSLAEKASTEARLRAERAAVERATAEARERAFEKVMAERAAFEARERIQRSISDKFSSSSREAGPRPRFLSSNSAKFESAEGEPAERCRARFERHRRTDERVAKALEEKYMRDQLVQREQAEKNRLAEILDADIRRWSSGKEGNLRALLSTLQYILGPDSGWQPIPLTEVITAAAVKKAYRKATLCVHPDKLQQRGASVQQKYVCEKVFDLLKEAWNKFNSEER